MSVEFMFGTILVLQLCVIYALYKMWDTRFSSRYVEQRITWLRTECLTLWNMLRQSDEGSYVDSSTVVKEQPQTSDTGVSLEKRDQAAT